jgi:hypothetical protein
VLKSIIMSAEHIDPFDLLINGERATDAEIQRMEQAAVDILEPLAVTATREYGYVSDSGALALVRSHSLHGEQAPTGTLIEILLAESADKGPCFQIVFNPNNRLHDLRFDNGNAQALNDAYLVAGNLLASDAVRDDEEGGAFLNCLQRITAICAGTARGNGDEAQYMADIARRLLVARTHYETQHTEHYLESDDGSTLRLVQRKEVADRADRVQGGPLELQINYKVPSKKAHYSYVRHADGRTTLECLSLGSPNETQDTVERGALNEFRQHYGMDQPSRHDVVLLTGIMQEVLVSQQD